MSAQDIFIELHYGKYYLADLHGCTVEEARAELIYLINSLDYSYKNILVVHGYHLGTSLKKFVRDKFTHTLVIGKVNIDAGTTLLRLER